MTGRTAPIGPKTVRVMGSHWKESAPWSGLKFDWSLTEVRSGSIWSNDDYHLRVPFIHPDDEGGTHEEENMYYRVRLKRPWKSFVKIGGVWHVSKDKPAE